MKRKTMMIIKKKKVNLVNEDAKTRRNPASTLGICLTAVKVAQCRQVAMNRIEMEGAKNIITAKNTATRKVHLQLKRSFQKAAILGTQTNGEELP